MPQFASRPTSGPTSGPTSRQTSYQPASLFLRRPRSRPGAGLHTASRHAARALTSAATLALALASALLGAQAASATESTESPPPDYDARYYVTADGCTYSRAHAYGYHPTWHLVLNASLIGYQDAHAGCAAMLDTGVPSGIVSTSGY